MVSFCSLANCERTHRHHAHGHLLGRDTTLFWSGTCRNPYQVQTFLWAQLKVPIQYAQKNRILRTHILSTRSNTKSRTWLYTCRDGRTLRLCYVLCRSCQHRDTLDDSQCTNTFQIGSIQAAFSCLSYSHDRKDTFWGYDPRDQMYTA